MDATSAAQELIRNKKMTGTIKQDASGMAEALCLLAKNSTTEGAGFLDGTGKYDVDKDVAKIRIAYSKYLG